MMERLSNIMNEPVDNKEVMIDNDLLRFLNSTPQEQKMMIGLK